MYNRGKWVKKNDYGSTRLLNERIQLKKLSRGRKGGRGKKKAGKGIDYGCEDRKKVGEWRGDIGAIR